MRQRRRKKETNKQLEASMESGISAFDRWLCFKESVKINAIEKFSEILNLARLREEELVRDIK